MDQRQKKSEHQIIEAYINIKGGNAHHPTHKTRRNSNETNNVTEEEEDPTPRCSNYKQSQLQRQSPPISEPRNEKMGKALYRDLENMK